MRSATPDLPRHWRAFLTEVDQHLSELITLHCLGGFVVEVSHGRALSTNDLDYIGIEPLAALEQLESIAGKGSGLAEKHHLHFQHVGVASLPESYAERLTELLPGHFQHLRLFEVEAHDLALSKLARNEPRDREDVAHLFKSVPLSPDVLRARYHTELRPIIVGVPEWHDRTLEMWIEAYSI